MTRKQFWQGASNWGFLGGAALFGVNLIGWALKLETNLPWVYELLTAAVLLPLIVVTGRRNAAASGAAGWPFGRAWGFVVAMMMFAGVVYGVGRFLLTNFIAPEYYGVMNETLVAEAMKLYGPSMQAMMADVSPMMGAMMRNPFYLIFQAVVELIFKGGFLGLVLCPIFTRKPDIFADGSNEA